VKETGLISKFGGPNDTGMKWDEGLAFYWDHAFCDDHPQLFNERSKDLSQGTSKRLRNLDAYYIALNIALDTPISIARNSKWKVANPETGDYVIAVLVDRGPAANGRLIDASDAVLRAIGVETDQIVEVEEITRYEIKFGLYDEMNHQHPKHHVNVRNIQDP
jgi:hypothetical protein